MRQKSLRETRIKKFTALLIPLLFLPTYYILYVLRSFDDNRLTSWNDSFIFTDFYGLLSLFIAGILCVYLLMRLSFIERHPVVFLFIISFAAGIVFMREPEIILDSSRYFIQAKHLELYGIAVFLRDWGHEISAWTDMPAASFFFGVIFRIFGEHRLYIQIFNTLLFSMTIALTYYTGKILWDEMTGFCAGLLMMGIPYLYSQIPLMLSDVTAMFFLALTIFAFIKAIEKGGVFIFIASAPFFFTFYAKYSTWLMLLAMICVSIAVFLIYKIMRPSEIPKDAIKRGIAILVAGALLIGIFYLYKRDVISEQMRLLVSYQKPGLNRWGESFLSTFFFQIHPWLTIFALYSIAAAIRNKDPKYLIIACLPLLVVAMRIRRIRYIIMVFPMLSLCASYGLMKLKSKETAKMIALSIAVTSFIIAAFLYLPFLNRMSLVNLRDAGKFLDSVKGSDVTVFVVSPENPVANHAVSVPLLDIYTNKKIHFSYNPDFHIDKDEILKSSLRFTFEYKNPRYYNDAAYSDRKPPVVLITGEKDAKIPPSIYEKVKDYSKCASFKQTENIFLHQTLVTVYYE